MGAGRGERVSLFEQGHIMALEGQIREQARTIEGLRDYTTHLARERYEAVEALRALLACRKYGRGATGSPVVIVATVGLYEALVAKYARVPLTHVATKGLRDNWTGD